MMFEEDWTTLPRAYVALSHDYSYEDRDKDLAATIAWCLALANGDARLVGIQTGHEDDLDDEPLLAAFVAEGAKVYTDSRGKVGALPSGPVLMYRPHAAHLWEVETKRSTAAVAAYEITGPEHHQRSIGTEEMVGCQPWVTAFKPIHLGGPTIKVKEPILPDPVVAADMDTFTDLINSSSGLSDSRDRSTVLDGLTKLRKANHHFDPEDLLAGALARNWRGDAAVQLKDLAAEINAGKRKRFAERFRPDIVDTWRKEV
ncbi:hypothetical protein [Paenarthrobacter sp. CAP02]|uniref:hypothetical protein n=1 Tax=Paenarthrobacter sp. CAP02 TaxID=3158144 RepID=UPI0032DB2595